MEFSRKSAAGLVLVISLIAGAFVWGNDRPTSGTWAIRGLTALGAVAGFLDILWHYLRPDREPDYLHRIQGRYFNRLGLAFVPVIVRQNRTCAIRLFAQNQRDQPCSGLVVLSAIDKPLNGTLIPFALLLEPGEFCEITVPLETPLAVQGRSVRFQVGATVTYPNGPGNLLRFREGTVIEVDHSLNQSALATAVNAASQGIGLHLRAALPGRVRLTFPAEVDAELPNLSPPGKRTLWARGQDPLPIDWRDRALSAPFFPVTS